MITNPYKVLGVPDGAGEEECTRAYKRLAKKYHPDLNPDNPAAAEKMAEINAAYDQIKSGNTASYSSGYGGYNSYSNQSRYRRNQNSTPDYYTSIAQFINNRQFRQALNLLNQIDDKTAQWYYLSAVANMGMGNREIALSHIQQACAMEPNNTIYSSVYAQIRSGMRPEGYGSPFGNYGSYTYEEYNTPNNGRVYVRRNRGCISRILRFFFIIFIIRIIILLLFSLVSPSDRSRYRAQQTNPFYENETTAQNNYDDYFGSNDGSDAVEN